MMDGMLGAIRHPWDTPPAEAAALEIAPGVLWLRLPLPSALNHVNCYALDEGTHWTIVDTGMASRRSRTIWQALLDGPLAGKPVGRVVVTHHHPDHMGLAGWFQTEHGAELWTTRTAWLFARMLTLDEQDAPRPESLDFWRAAGMDAARLAQRAAERPFNFADVVAPMPLGFKRIRHGDVLRMAGRDWVMHEGAGHAPEHATFGARIATWSWGAISFCPASRPILVSMPPSRTPIRSATGSRPAHAWPMRRARTIWSCPDTSCPLPACRCVCARRSTITMARWSGCLPICRRRAPPSNASPRCSSDASMTALTGWRWSRRWPT